jgi:RNA polymerase sigma-70 factor, ECF subfamily
MTGTMPGVRPSFAGASEWEQSRTRATRPTIIGAMGLQELTDEELVARSRDDANLQERELYVDELFRRNYARVGRWCLRFASDRESAADLAQEVFARAYQNLSSFQGQSKFSSWLFSIARNHCLNAIRSNNRQAAELKADVEEDFLGEIPDTRERPGDELDRQATAEQVAQLLTSALDETERVVFTLHYGEELSLDAITRMLALENASGAKAYIVSAKRKLSRWISQKKVVRP